MVLPFDLYHYADCLMKPVKRRVQGVRCDAVGRPVFICRLSWLEEDSDTMHFANLGYLNSLQVRQTISIYLVFHRPSTIANHLLVCRQHIGRLKPAFHFDATRSIRRLVRRR